MSDMKSYEDLINEIFELREDLGKKKKFATAAKAVEELAKKQGVDFVATEKTTYEEYVAVLNVIVDQIVQKYTDEMEQLWEQLEDERKNIETITAINKESVAKIEELNKKISTLNKRYDELYVGLWKSLTYNKKALSNTVEQARKWKSEYLKTVGWLDMILEKYEQVVIANKELKKEIEKARQRTGDEIAITKEDLELLKKDLKRLEDDKKTVISHTEIYAKTVKIIVDSFRRHGYDILPLGPAATKKDAKRNRAWELDAAVRQAARIDERSQKQKEIFYQEAGLTNIKKEIANAFDKMIKELKVAAPELVMQFYKEMGIDPEKVPPTDQIIDKIIYAESDKKPFLKTTGGRVLVIALVTIMIAGVLIPIFASRDNEQDVEQGDDNDTEADSDLVPPDVEIDIESTDQEVLDNFLQDANIALPGINPTNVESITIENGVVEIVYSGYNGFAEPIQERITFEAPSSWATMDEASLTAEFILNNIPKGAEKVLFESASSNQQDDAQDSANSTFESESDIDDEIEDDDLDLDDTDDDIDLDEDIDSEVQESVVPPTFDSSAPMISWKVVEKGGRVKVTGTMIVDGDEVEFTTIGTSVEQCKDNILETFWENGYDVDYEMVP